MSIYILDCSNEEMDRLLNGESIQESRRMGESDDRVYYRARDRRGRGCYVVSDIGEEKVTFTPVEENPLWSTCGHLRILTSHGVTMARAEKGRAVIRTWPSKEEAKAYAREELAKRCGLRGFKPFEHEGEYGLSVHVSS